MIGTTCALDIFKYIGLSKNPELYAKMRASLLTSEYLTLLSDRHAPDLRSMPFSVRSNFGFGYNLASVVCRSVSSPTTLKKQAITSGYFHAISCRYADSLDADLRLPTFINNKCLRYTLPFIFSLIPPYQRFLDDPIVPLASLYVASLRKGHNLSRLQLIFLLVKLRRASELASIGDSSALELIIERKISSTLLLLQPSFNRLDSSRRLIVEKFAFCIGLLDDINDYESDLVSGHRNMLIPADGDSHLANIALHSQTFFEEAESMIRLCDPATAEALINILGFGWNL